MITRELLLTCFTSSELDNFSSLQEAYDYAVNKGWIEPVNQENNELQKYWMELDNDKLIATDFYSGKQYEVARFYRKNILSQHFLDCVRYDGKQLQLTNRKDVLKYFTPVN